MTISDTNRFRCDWQKAEWISLAENPEPGYSFFYARREFSAVEACRSAILHITADRFYRLYVNGEFVGEGPPRNTVVAMTYSSYDITPLLAERNVISVVIHQNGNEMWRRNNFYSTPPERFQRMTLCAQLELTGVNGTTERIGTDPDWRVLPGYPWDPRAPQSEIVSQAEIYSASEEPQGWDETGFDDSSWQVPSLNQTRDRYFRDAPEQYKPYTTFEPSITPAPRRSVLRPARIHAVGEVTEIDGGAQFDIALKMGLEQMEECSECRIENQDSLVEQCADPTVVRNAFRHSDKKAFYDYWDTHEGVPAVKHATIVLDFGELLNGYFSLDVEGKDGIIDIAWGETLINGRVMPKLYHGDTAVGTDLSFADRYILTQGRQQWESFHYHSFRYVQLTFRNMNEAIILHRFTAIKTEPQFPERGDFACSDDVLTWSWHATKRTLKLCTHDTFFDNTFREKRVWSGDCGGNSMLTALTCFGDEPITLNFLKLFTAHRESQHFLENIIDNDNEVRGYVEKPDLFLWPIRMAYASCEYFYYSSNSGFLKDNLYPTLKDIVSYVFRFLNERALIGAHPGIEHIDWADVDAAKEGAGAPANLLFHLLLKKLAPVARHYGEEELAADYVEKAERMAEEVYGRFWNEEAELYVDRVVDDTQRTRVFSEHTNYLAMLTGLGRGGREKKILRSLRRRDLNLTESDTTCMGYVLQALFAVGHAADAIEMMKRRYNRFCRAGSDTLWEEFSYLMTLRSGKWHARYRALAQSAACVPAYILTSEVLGVKPTAFAFEEFTVEPKMGDLTRVSGVVPTPKGDISVACRQEDDRFSIEVVIPGGARASVHLPHSLEFLVNDQALDDSKHSYSRNERGLCVQLGEGAFHLQGVSPRNR